MFHRDELNISLILQYVSTVLQITYSVHNISIVYRFYTLIMDIDTLIMLPYAGWAGMVAAGARDTKRRKRC